MIEAVRTSETSAYSNEATHCYISEGSHFHIRRRENLKSYNLSTVDLGFPLSVSFHRGSPCSDVIWEMNNRPVSGRSSET
jgi:hypothetical protein